MKLYQVSYTEDGATTKSAGKTATDVLRYDLFFAAESIDKVCPSVVVLP